MNTRNCFFITLLQDEIKCKMGFLEVNTYNVKKIALAIEEATKQLVSESTLQRFFELIPVNTNFREPILDILSEFVGYSSWQQFCKTHQDQIGSFQNIRSNSLNSSLLEICLKNGNFDTIIDFINQLSVPIDKQASPDSRKTLMADEISETIAKYCRKSPKIAKAILPELAKTKQGQFYFYESYVSNHEFYLDAIENHYFRYIHRANPEFGKNDLCFAYAMMFHKYLEQGDTKRLFKVGAEWFNEIKPEQINDEKIDRKPWLRYHIYRLYFLTLKKSLSTSYLGKVLQELSVFLETEEYLFVIRLLFQILYESKQYDILINLFTNTKDTLRNQHIICADLPTNLNWHLEILLNVYYYVIASYEKNISLKAGKALAEQASNIFVPLDIHNIYEKHTFRRLQYLTKLCE